MKGYFLIIAVLVIFFSNVYSQTNWVSLKFNHLTTKNGLSNSEVNRIVQDKHGYIWIGTKDGLNRYDGFNFKVYKHNSNKPDILIDNTVTGLHIDNAGKLWVGTIRGISVYNEKADNFKNIIFDSIGINNNISNRVNAFVNDNNDVIAVTEEGKLYRINNQTLHTENIDAPVMGLIKAMVRDSKGHLIIGSLSGLYMFSFKKGIISYLTKQNNKLPTSRITSLCLNTNELWIGTEDAGIIILDIVTHNYKQIKSSVLGHDYIQNIEMDKSGNFWVGSYAGLRLFKDGNIKSFDYYHIKEDPLSLGGSGITSIYADIQDNIWIGLGHLGIDYIINTKKFEHYRNEPLSPYGLDNDVTSVVLYDSKGRLWVGSHNGGIGRIEKNKTGILRIKQNESYGLDISSVQSIYEDRNGTVWVGTYSGGLYKWSENMMRFSNYRANPENSNSLPCNDIRSITEDSLGNLWLVTHGFGVTKFDTKNKKFTNFRHDYVDPQNSILDDWSFYIKRTHDGLLWIGGTSGITVMDPYNLTFKFYQNDPKNNNTIIQGFVNYIFEDSKKQIWVATDYGFCKYDANNHSFIGYSEKIGMPLSRICGIQEDSEQNLWISSSNGLFKFNPFTRKLKVFDENDGLQSNEFSPGACTSSPIGELFFGGRSGVSGFLPSEIHDIEFVPPVLITDIKLFNESVLNPIDWTEEKETIRKSFLKNKNISLTYKHNVITIEYVAFNYINPRKNKYAYKLQGFDDRWDTVVNKREVSYTNLNPGKYKFIVKACNSDGYWNQSGDSLYITIVPPYWKTTWFKILVILVFTSFVFLILYLRFQRIKQTRLLLEHTVTERTQELRNATEEIMQQRDELALHRDHLEEIVHIRTRELENAKHKAEESDRLKSSFLANMSHEIRTPMNAITGFIYLLREEDIEQELKNKYLDIISRNSDVLLRLIDDILDFSKIEAGELKITFNNVSIIELLEELNTSYTSIVKERSASSMRNVSYITNIQLDKKILGLNPKLIVSADKMRLNQILTNLIENAIKFTEKGFIEVGIESGLFVDNTGRYLELYVKDTGIGIPAEDVPYIFDRFRKVETNISKIYQGVGLGLAISKRLSFLLGGSLNVTSHYGDGSKFSLFIPYPENYKELIGTTNEMNDNTKENLLSIDTGKATVLITEDDESNYKYLETLLKKDGYKVIWAKDGAEGVKMALENNVSIVLMDIKLPVLNGMMAMKRIKDIKPKLPVIAQTAYAMSNEKMEMLKAGFNDYIAKPITHQKLIDTIRKYL